MRRGIGGSVEANNRIKMLIVFMVHKIETESMRIENTNTKQKGTWRRKKKHNSEGHFKVRKENEQFNSKRTANHDFH